MECLSDEIPDIINELYYIKTLPDYTCSLTNDLVFLYIYIVHNILELEMKSYGRF